MNEEEQKPNIPMALLVGLVAAVVAGLIWYFVVTLTEWKIGIVSILMGWLVGQAVVWGSGHKRGATLQWLSIILTVVAIIGSEYFIFNHFFQDAGFIGNLTISEFFEVYGDHFTEGKGFLDIIFFAIAVWQAYSVPKKR